MDTFLSNPNPQTGFYCFSYIKQDGCGLDDPDFYGFMFCHFALVDLYPLSILWVFIWGISETS